MLFGEGRDVSRTLVSWRSLANTLAHLFKGMVPQKALLPPGRARFSEGSYRGAISGSVRSAGTSGGNNVKGGGLGTILLNVVQHFTYIFGAHSVRAYQRVHAVPVRGTAEGLFV